MGFLAGLLEMFVIGLGTPLTAVCVIPLYPAYVAYLANADGAAGGIRSSPLALGVIILVGVLAFMAAVGFVISFLLRESVEGFVGTVSPVAFVILLGLGLVLLADLKVFGRVPQVDPPQFQYPSATAFSYGFFFGAIIIPCNPGLIALAFGRNPILFDTQLASFLGFLAFGLGIGVPLLALAVVSESFGRRVTTWIARHGSLVNRATGLLLVLIALYYVLVVFQLVALPAPMLEALEAIPVPTGNLGA